MTGAGRDLHAERVGDPSQQREGLRLDAFATARPPSGTLLSRARYSAVRDEFLASRVPRLKPASGRAVTYHGFSGR